MQGHCQCITLCLSASITVFECRATVNVLLCVGVLVQGHCQCITLCLSASAGPLSMYYFVFEC